MWIRFTLLQVPKHFEQYIDKNTALVAVQYPDFFGRIYDFTALAEKAHAEGAMLAISVNPMALGLFTPPGKFGADIVTGEGQSLGIPLSFGGPYLGIFATRLEYVRKMAGRLVGETVDNRGQRSHVDSRLAALQAYRPEKATSIFVRTRGLMRRPDGLYEYAGNTVTSGLRAVRP